MTPRERPAPRPWYREFWPWFIIALLSSVVIASLFTVVLAFKHSDEPASGDYKRDGLGIVDGDSGNGQNTLQTKESPP